MTLRITLALPDRRLCGNGRTHGIARSRLVKAQREAAAYAARAAIRAAGLAPVVFPTGRVRVDLTVRRDPLWAARRLDDDNLIRGCKAAIDGLTDAGVWTDDRQVRWGDIAWEAAPACAGELVLTLRPAAPGEGE